ncbi:MAG: hypothetical protein IPL84_03880 [Chitinophagaceae bacterium]|nr:hypothetical protein [Chitinophagaceae bacterium]
MKLLAIFTFSILLIAGCCNVKQVTIPEVDTIIIEDTTQLVDSDSLWVGLIHADGNSIGSLAVNPKSKKAIVNIKWLKPDTVYYEVPTNNYMIVESILTRVLESAFLLMPWYYKVLLVLLACSALYVVYKIQKSKFKNQK